MKPINEAGVLTSTKTVSLSETITLLIDQPSLKQVWGHCSLNCSISVSSLTISSSWAKPIRGNSRSVVKQKNCRNLLITWSFLGIELVNDASNHSVNDRATVAQRYSV